MISYKQWQTMNESFVGTFASILSNPVTVGGVVGGLGGTEAALEEGKKKCKKMDAGTIGDEKDEKDVESDAPDDKEGDDKGKKLPPWLQKKSEAKDSGSFDPEGDQAGKVLPWLNRKGNHGAQDKKNAHDKLQKISDKVKKEAAEAIDDLFFASLRSQAGTATTKNSDGFTALTDDQLATAVRPEPTVEESEESQPGDVGFAPNGRLFQLAGMTDDEGNSLIKSIPTLGQDVKKN